MVPENGIKIIYFLPPVSLNDKSVSNLTFYSALESRVSSELSVRYLHAAWYDNKERAIYLSSSLDGKTFTIKPRKIMDIEGKVMDLKIIAKDDDFVITAIENIGEVPRIRAATGVITKEKMYDFKPCEKLEVKGDLINVYTAWTKTENQDNSTDYFFFRPKCPPDHHFDLESEKCVPNEPGVEEETPAGGGSGSHCTRLSILRNQNL
jgi:hypothetical protein